MFDAGIWGTVAEWFAAVGTIGAVGTSLWLVRRDGREVIQMSAELPTNHGNSLLIQLENFGKRPVTIKTLWFVVRAGREEKGRLRYPFVKIPVRLEPGSNGEVTWPYSSLLPFIDSVASQPGETFWVEGRSAMGSTFKAPAVDLVGQQVVEYLGDGTVVTHQRGNRRLA